VSRLLTSFPSNRRFEKQSRFRAGSFLQTFDRQKKKIVWYGDGGGGVIFAAASDGSQPHFIVR
jgi:hypothetical protein